mgnify:FL=1
MAVGPVRTFTLAEAARLTGLERSRIHFWCAAWGAGLVKPEEEGGPGRPKRLSERQLVQVAVIPHLIAARLSLEQIAGLFSHAEPEWWELAAAVAQNPAFLDWIVVVWDARQAPLWFLLSSAYEAAGVGAGAWAGLQQLVDRVPGFRSFQVIELSHLKRALLARW